MASTGLSAVAQHPTSIAPINGSWDSSLGNSFHKLGTINSLSLDAANNLYVAGDFNYINQTEVNGLARWNGTSWNGYGLKPADNGKIRNVLSFDNSLFAIGSFGSLQQARNNIARWDGTQFQALGTGLTGHLTPYPTETYAAALASFGGMLYVGGDFTHFDGRPAYGIGQWNGEVVSQTVDFEWMVNSFASNGTDFIAGGIFTAVGDTSSRLARFVNNQWQPFDVGITNTYFTVYNAQNTIYLAGYSQASNTYQLYRLNGTNAISVGNSLTHSIDNLVGIGSDLYIQSNQQLLKLTNNQWQTPNLPFTINTLTALTATNSTLYLGGNFQLNGNPSQIIAWNGTQAQSLATLFAIDNQSFLSGDAGRPIVINQKQQTGPDASIRRWNGTSWQTLATTSTYTFGGMQLQRVNDQLFSFFYEPQAFIHAQPASKVWRFDGAALTPIAVDLPSMAPWYQSGSQMFTYLAEPQATLPITGIYEFDGTNLQHRLQPAWFDAFDQLFFFNQHFYAIDVIPDMNADYIEIRRWNNQTWEVLKFIELPDADYQFLLWNQRLLMASSIGKLYEIDNAGNVNELASADGGIYAIAGRDDGSVYLGGDFNTIDGVATGPIASFNGANFRGLASQPNGRVTSLSVDRNYLYVGGNFTNVGATPSLGVAVFAETKNIYLPIASR
ncbi:hypothetical protein [Herpetosiphon geysericola]|uniref:Uncharacterized protein n=1 Tax=Herpetosiphon geysericola TaxID=70996 RepID=A0A0P6YAL3_9CHLR|nr:hypothetical protein [Herpetosiphon geysericola]KPL87059.1 hypothetical protein SE18_11255 [Herpetosiphon geysericola]